MAETTRKRRGLGLKIFLGVVILLIVIWFGGWYAASRMAGSEIDRLVAAFAAHGGHATCNERGVRGFPFSFDVACSAIGFDDQAGNRLGFAGLRAAAPLYRPGEVNLSLAGPLHIDLPREPEPILATWSDASAQARLSLSGLSTVSALIHQLHVEVSGLPPATLGQVDLSLSPVGGDYRFGLAISDGELRMADGSTAVKLAAGADLTALGLGSSLGTDPANLILGWLRSGGSLRLDRVAISADDAKASATGELTLLPDGLLSGAVTIALSGLENLPDTAERVLSGTRDEATQFVGFVKGFARQVKDGDVVTGYEIPLRIRNGRVSIGLIPVATLPALTF